jgi:hypothetical protein
MRNLSTLALLALLILPGCNRVWTKQTKAAPSHGPSIALFVPANARRVGASMPVQISVSIPTATDASTSGTEACVALAAGPGTLRPVFHAACTPPPSAQGDAGVLGGFSNPVWGCLGLNAAGGVSTGSTLAIYSPKDQEEIVTLVGGLYADSSCAGTPIASIAVVVDLSPLAPADGGTSSPDSSAPGNISDGAPAEAAATDGDSTDGGDSGNSTVDGCTSVDDGGPDAGCGP